MTDQGSSRWYGTLEKALLAGILGGTLWGGSSNSKLAEEFAKFRETVLVAMARYDSRFNDHEKRIERLEEDPAKPRRF